MCLWLVYICFLMWIGYILGTTRWTWWARITQLVISSGWASTVAGRSNLKLILQVPSSASGSESSLSRVKSRKQWVSQGVRWETLSLASSPAAFVSCWTKQCHPARAGICCLFFFWWSVKQSTPDGCASALYTFTVSQLPFALPSL